MLKKNNSLWVACALVACAVVIGLSSCSSKPAKPVETFLPQHTLLDADWRFHRGDLTESNRISMAGYDDAPWQAVDVPHDYILDGQYNPKGDRGHGYLPLEPAWYRKHFVIPRGDKGKVLQLDFDGVFSDSDVWLNGEYLGHHSSGYTGFTYDISAVANCGGENIITVRVDPRRLEGWWYEGGGIYRHVWFNALNRVHLAQYGVYVVSQVPNGNTGADELANITMQTTVENDARGLVNCTVLSEIVGPDGTSLAMVANGLGVAAGEQNQLEQHTVLLHPRLWSPDSPQLYQLRTTIFRAGQAMDSTITTFGIRTLRYDATNGFFLNGKHVEIQGVACHQDFPAVGIALPDSLQWWRVAQLKKFGANGWRTAHNPPSEAALDACDKLGMLVMSENRHLGNTYNHHSPKGTVFTNADDLTFMIKRDRNHPSIIMWSMCNEEPLQGTPEGAHIFSAMMDVVHQYDRTRPITCAMNAGWLKPEGIADVEDIIGVNYNGGQYAAIHKQHPTKPMYASETANNKTARSNYAYDRTNGLISSYNLTDSAWLPVATNAFMCGMYEWTGFDYRGEPNPDGWPDISNNTGILDACGFPKDKAYYLKSWWSTRPMVHIMPIGWNWPGKEGQPIRVLAFSNARAVELFLNGKSLGVQTMPQFGHLEWQVPYESGHLLAKAITAGQVVATDLVETVDAPASIQLSPDRLILHPDGEDTVVVPVSILDDHGRLVADAGNHVTFQLAGGGKLLGVGNGNPADHDPDRASERNAFNGHCIAVIQAGRHRDTLQLTATSPGLAPATVTFEVK